MKKILLAFLIIGAIIMLIALAMVGFDLRKAEKMLSESYTVVENITSLDIECSRFECDVIVKSTSESQTRIEFYYPEKKGVSYEVTDGTLVIKNEKNISSLLSLVDFGNSSRIIVYLPDKAYDEIKINSDTGDVRLSSLSSRNLSVEVSTGDVTINDLQVFDKITINGSTADHELHSVTANALTIKNSTGDVSVENATLSSFDITTSTGEVEINDLIASSHGNIKTSSGAIEIERMTVEGTLFMKSGTGDIEFSRLDAYEIYATASTGEIEGDVLTPKNFVTETSTGKVSVPSPDTSKGIFNIKTSTGDIKIRISD
ncbi:MAG: DUF4097 family beta strand repeat protein [Clostridia bacterium]|nr:DUF4097 family beta strand repeat protein [Clostridia bacterium]